MQPSKSNMTPYLGRRSDTTTAEGSLTVRWLEQESLSLLLSLHAPHRPGTIVGALASEWNPMTAFAMNPNRSSQGESDDTQPTRFAAGEKGTAVDAQDLLERVIRETNFEGADDASGVLRDKLLEVARRHPNSQLELDPVVIEMVKVVLGSQLKRSLQGMNKWEEMVSLIAQTLFADSAARERLNSLWTQLSEAGHG